MGRRKQRDEGRVAAEYRAAVAQLWGLVEAGRVGEGVAAQLLADAQQLEGWCRVDCVQTFVDEYGETAE